MIGYYRMKIPAEYTADIDILYFALEVQRTSLIIKQSLLQTVMYNLSEVQLKPLVNNKWKSLLPELYGTNHSWVQWHK